MPHYSRKEYLFLILKGLEWLTEKSFKTYLQKEVAGKMTYLGTPIKNTDLSKLKAEINEVLEAEKKEELEAKKISIRRLKKVGTVLEELMKLELCMKFDPKLLDFVELKDGSASPQIVPIKGEEIKTIKENPPYIFHDKGRLTTPYKAGFIAKAKTELIELGVKLEQLSNYFFTRGTYEYQDHIIQLLKKGVTVKFFILAPNSNIAKSYFKERSKARGQKTELDALHKLPKIRDRFIQIIDDLNNKGYEGKMELYTYEITPYNHFIAVDSDKPYGKMIISHYIYGLRRAEAPMLEFHRADNPGLYDRYLRSLQEYIASAQKIYPVG